MSPRWIDRAYWLVGAAAWLAFMFAIVARVGEYASGAALVQLDRRAEGSAPSGAGASFSVVALLPGHFRPLLRPGDQLRLDLAGYRYNSRRLTVDSVSERVVGPSEVRRLLGEDVAGALNASGPVVIVRARLPEASFVEEGRALAYYDGMRGVAEVRVRSQPVIFALIPSLRGLI